MAKVVFNDYPTASFVPYDENRGLRQAYDDYFQWGVVGWDSDFREIGHFRGSGLLYSGVEKDRVPTGGVITQASFFNDRDDGSEPKLEITDLKLDPLGLKPIFDGDVSSEAQRDFLLDLVLSGDDTITAKLSTNPEIAISVSGDLAQAVKNSVVAGSDYIELKVGKVELWGDAPGVSSRGRLTGGADKVLGWTGNDALYGDVDSVAAGGRVTGGADTVIGRAGDDVLYGDARSVARGATLKGGNDILKGSEGNDTLYGDVETAFGTVTGGKDQLFGESGDDTLFGGGGIDRLSGGSGKDTFVFDTKLDGKTNIDVIADFSSKDDSFRLDNDVFTGLKAGTLEDYRFKVVGYGSQKEGVDKSDRILYDKDDGDLFFDRDGRLDKYKPIKFAEVKDNTTLSHADFLIV